MREAIHVRTGNKGTNVGNKKKIKGNTCEKQKGSERHLKLEMGSNVGRNKKFEAINVGKRIKKGSNKCRKEEAMNVGNMKEIKLEIIKKIRGN